MGKNSHIKKNAMTEIIYRSLDKIPTKKRYYRNMWPLHKFTLSQIVCWWKAAKIEVDKKNSVIACDKDDHRLMPEPRQEYRDEKGNEKFKTSEDIENMLDKIFGMK